MSIHFKRFHFFKATPVQKWVIRILSFLIVGGVFTYFIYPQFSILLKAGVSWYCPYKMLEHAEKQVLINNEEPIAQSIKPSKLLNDKNVLHILIFDHTTPKLNETGYIANLKGFGKSVREAFPNDECKVNIDTSARMSTLVGINVLSQYFKYYPRNDKLLILNYDGNKHSVEPFKYNNTAIYTIEDNSQKRGLYFNELIKNIKIYENAVIGTTRTDFSILFSQASKAYIDVLNTINIEDPKQKIESVTIDFFSDFIHESSLMKQHIVSKNEVEAEMSVFMKNISNIKKINLFILPVRNDDLQRESEMHTWVKRNLITKMKRDGLFIDYLSEEAFANEKQLKEKNLALCNPIVKEEEAIQCFYSFENQSKSDFATAKIKFENIKFIKLTSQNGLFTEDSPRVELVKCDSTKNTIIIASNFESHGILENISYDINVWDNKNQPSSSDLALSYEFETDKNEYGHNGFKRNHIVPIIMFPKLSKPEAIVLRFLIVSTFLFFFIGIIQLSVTNIKTGIIIFISSILIFIVLKLLNNPDIRNLCVCMILLIIPILIYYISKKFHPIANIINNSNETFRKRHYNIYTFLLVCLTVIPMIVLLVHCGINNIILTEFILFSSLIALVLQRIHVEELNEKNFI